MKKPKKIPKGFIWDSKHKELIDVRVNNPKLKALIKNSVRATQIITSKYHKGTIPIGDTLFNILVWDNEQFEKTGEAWRQVGWLWISGKYVGDQMDTHQSIKGYEPSCIAQSVTERLCEKYYPQYDTVVVREVCLK